MRTTLFTCLLVLATAGCESTTHRTQATLVEDTDTARTLIREALSRELGRGTIEFGPGDLSQMSQVTVLPPPVVAPVTASPDLPVTFDIVLVDERCMLVRSDTEKRIPVEGLNCRPLP